MGWELAGEDVIGKEVGSSPRKPEVLCSAAREMCEDVRLQRLVLYQGWSLCIGQELKWLEVLLTRGMRVFQHSVFL